MGAVRHDFSRRKSSTRSRALAPAPGPAAIIDQHLQAEIAEIEKTSGRDLTEQEQNFVVSRALVAHTDPNTGIPDVQAAYKELEAIWGDRQKTWTQTNHL